MAELYSPFGEVVELLNLPIDAYPPTAVLAKRGRAKDGRYGIIGQVDSNAASGNYQELADAGDSHAGRLLFRNDVVNYRPGRQMRAEVMMTTEFTNVKLKANRSQSVHELKELMIYMRYRFKLVDAKMYALCLRLNKKKTEANWRYIGLRVQEEAQILKDIDQGERGQGGGTDTRW